MVLTAYDAAVPPLAAILASDCTAVCCYTDGDYAYKPEWIGQIVAAGKGVLANHENAQDELLGGFNAGVNAAVRAMLAVRDWPIKPPAIYYSVDMNVDPSSKEFAAVLQAFQGIKDTMQGEYLIGCYGEGELIHELYVNQLTSVSGWLSASIDFPGYDRDSPFVGMYQQVGSNIPDTDRNVITRLATMGFYLPRKVTTMNVYRVPDGQGHTYTTNLFSAEMLVSGAADAWAQAECKAGRMFDAPDFPPEQLVAILASQAPQPSAGKVTGDLTITY